MPNIISIHAPLAGCDENEQLKKSLGENFNPRTPCGVRRPQTARTPMSVNFNPRTPCGVRPNQT